MIKDDESLFLAIMQMSVGPAPTRKTPRELINELDFPLSYKRAWYLLEKWCDRGLYEFGVTLDLGWMTEAGMTLDPQSYNGELSNEGKERC